MKAIEIARKLAKLNQTAEAQDAYALVLQENDGADPALDFEAASYIFFSGGNYEVAYTYFQKLYNQGHFQSELFDIMVKAFYAPNLKPQQDLYQRNCKLLNKYPYLFRKDFLPFDDLPIKFFPFNEEGFLPFSTRENHFGAYVNFNHPVIDRNFFADLENPILAVDVYSQYQLEYLNDNVRKSEWAARENHIYLHYTDWSIFCSYLQCVDFRDVLKSEKIVFLIEEEKSLYPIDFKARFGIDYTQYTVKPFAPKEITRLIWHTQLAAHNGGDFFNEIFHGHPNLLADTSIMFDSLRESVESMKKALRKWGSHNQGLRQLAANNGLDFRVVKNLSLGREVSDKDVLAGIFLGNPHCNKYLDPNARIAPALFLQPHFPNIYYELTRDEKKRAVLDSNEYEKIRRSPLFLGFKYIKTFTPMRRITTSYAGTVKFMNAMADMDQQEGEKTKVVSDVITERLLNRSFMIDWQDRLFKDSRLVRFEDGKLNPTATFTALAAFVDIPYTHSMTYCSDEIAAPGNAVGFDTSSVYRTYDEYANDDERYFLEYFLRDAYELYGYGFRYYDGQPVDEEKVKELIAGFTTLNGCISKTWTVAYQNGFPSIAKDGEPLGGEEKEAVCAKLAEKRIEAHDVQRLKVAKLLMGDLRFLNRHGQPLRMMPPLELDPALLEQPLYH